jgi:deoxyribonuclease IV
MMKIRFGVHVSIAGGLDRGLQRAVNLGCDAAQFFLVNPRGWKANPLSEDAVERFLQVRKEEAKGVRPLIAHMPYLPNLASVEAEIFEKSVAALRDHLWRCERLKIDFLVIHMGKGEAKAGIQRMREGVQRAYGDDCFSVRILLENSAGQGREIGYQIADLSSIYEIMPHGVLKGICLDTCHAFAAGYDIGSRSGLRKMVLEFDKYLGFSEVKLIHLNDSLKPVASRIDRHEKIGEGWIGKEGFRTFLSSLRIKSLPCILEVPVASPEEDRYQLQLVRELSSNHRK